MEIAVDLLVLPLCCSHLLQPLEDGVFAPLKRALASAVALERREVPPAAVTTRTVKRGDGVSGNTFAQVKHYEAFDRIAWGGSSGSRSSSA